MNKIDIVAENIASALLEEKMVNKAELAAKIKILLKVMYDAKSVDLSSKFKATTLDWVSELANKHKFRCNYWRGKCEELLNSKQKMKTLFKELNEKMEEQDFSSNRVKKAKYYELKK